MEWFIIGSISTILSRNLIFRYFVRIKSSDWFTPDVNNRWIKGVVTSVGDADNFRLYHTPAIGWNSLRRIPHSVKDLKDQTIHIRIAGIDAPEAAHFGRPAQPFAAESLAWLKHQISGKTVYCQLLHRDQYSRIVANVLLPPRLLPGALASGTSLQLAMIAAGWATTYAQAGAEYGKWGKDEFLRTEAAARAARRGMWKHGTSVETPAEYKRRYAQSASGAESQVTQKQSPSWLRALGLKK